MAKHFMLLGLTGINQKIKAEQIGKDIKSKLGVNFRVLYRPS